LAEHNAIGRPIWQIIEVGGRSMQAAISEWWAPEGCARLGTAPENQPLHALDTSSLG
jgi:hypothetical protein